jgi:hypothetical protein
MLAENVEIEHPYAPDGPLRIVGRAALVAHMRDADNHTAIIEFHVGAIERLETESCLVLGAYLTCIRSSG